jgi:PKD repeat protein
MRSTVSVTVHRLPHRAAVVLVVVGVGLAFLISGSSARADTIVSGPLSPSGVAVDGAGDVFIADSANNRVLVDKPNGSGGYTRGVVDDTGLCSPEGVAVDGSGDVFIADTCHNRVLVDKPNGSGGYTRSVVDDTGLFSPYGVAVDASGDVFFTDTAHNRVLVDKPNSSGGYTQSAVDDTGLDFPEGVAVDASGDVVIADFENNRVVVDKPNGTGGYSQSLVAAGLSRPEGVAVDGAGDVFISDALDNQVLVQKPNGGSVVDDTGLDEPFGVAVDGSGDVFIADSGNNRVLLDKPNGTGGYTHSVVDSPDLSSPHGVAVGESGDVFIADTGHNRVLLDKPNGTGGYTLSVVDSTGLSSPSGVAVDGSGDVFIADSGHDQVVVGRPNGTGGFTRSVVGPTGLSDPLGVAVDGSGDVFIADTGNNRVLLDKPNGTGGYTQSVAATGLSSPHGVAVDASGDVFIADTGHNQVLLDKPNGTGGYTQSVAATGLSSPHGVAVDASGDVFIADTGHNQVLLDKPNSSGGYTQSVVGPTGLSFPEGVAVDGSGEVFIADTGHNQVVLDKPNSTGSYTQSETDLGVTAPAGLAVDASRHVFIADTPNDRVVEHTATPPTATAAFTSAQIGVSFTVAFTDQSTAISPVTITGWSWNFGDGAPVSTQQNPSHTYASTGTYTVSLTVTDSTGQTSTVAAQLVVAAVHASLTYPTAGQTNVSTLTPFGWADIPAGQGYQLWIGTKRGDGSLLKSGLLSASTSTYKVPALPTGQTLWARLYTEVAGNWDNYQDITFTVTGNRVAFAYPTAGQQNINTITPFSWSPATNAQAYQLTIGTKPGLADLVNSGILAANVTTYREPALPTGKTLYAKIVAKIAGSWTDYQAISFTAGPNPVAFTHPTQGQTAVNTPAAFTWSTSPAATGYQLWIGTTRGSGSLLKSGWLKPSISSYGVPALPAGQTLYARIYTGVASGWGNYQDINFTTATASGGSAFATATQRRAVTNQLTALSAHQPTPAWMRRLLELEPDLIDPPTADSAEPESPPPTAHRTSRKATRRAAR